MTVAILLLVGLLALGLSAWLRHHQRTAAVRDEVRTRLFDLTTSARRRA